MTKPAPSTVLLTLGALIVAAAVLLPSPDMLTTPVLFAGDILACPGPAEGRRTLVPGRLRPDSLELDRSTGTYRFSLEVFDKCLRFHEPPGESTARLEVYYKGKLPDRFGPRTGIMVSGALRGGHLEAANVWTGCARYEVRDPACGRGYDDAY